MDTQGDQVNEDVQLQQDEIVNRFCFARPYSVGACERGWSTGGMYLAGRRSIPSQRLGSILA